ncbi:hypothetical protein QC764_0075460 [Podospora pseudoanserina]|uniref:Uncharacterized protein n=1 Tax=Podospora pseudoanserina TaxID=2609844 RepID=A0ABR0I497_9PEZI|nr:hypothetical protein QC764_0075460 [Podospora pseudoanserina]
MQHPKATIRALLKILPSPKLPSSLFRSPSRRSPNKCSSPPAELHMPKRPAFIPRTGACRASPRRLGKPDHAPRTAGLLSSPPAAKSTSTALHTVRGIYFSAVQLPSDGGKQHNASG